MSKERRGATLNEIISKGNDEKDTTYTADWERFEYEGRNDGIESVTARVFKNEQDDIVYIGRERAINLPPGDIPKELFDAQAAHEASILAELQLKTSPLEDPQAPEEETPQD